MKATTVDLTQWRTVFQFFQVNTCADSPVLPSCVQQALWSLHTLKIPCPPFNKTRPDGGRDENTQIAHNSSRIIKMRKLEEKKPEKKERNGWYSHFHWSNENADKLNQARYVKKKKKKCTQLHLYFYYLSAIHLTEIISNSFSNIIHTLFWVHFFFSLLPLITAVSNIYHVCIFWLVQTKTFT